MKTASLAFFVALGLAAALSVASLLGYDARSIGMLLDSERDAEEARTNAEPPTPYQAPRVDVPSGTFTGPTSQPTMVGPTGPPPQE